MGLFALFNFYFHFDPKISNMIIFKSRKGNKLEISILSMI